MKTTTNLQKSGGISALIAAATYLFAMVLVFTILAPMANSSLSFEKYVDFYKANKTLIFIWHFVMYLINGVCLVILALALYERLKSEAPTIMKIATVLGLIWASFVFLSGFIVLYGTEAFINLNGKNPIQAEILKKTIETITLGIDYSDRFLGCLWVGLVSMAAFKTSTFPKMLNVFGIIISILGLIGTVIPPLTAISYAFGMGAIVWWLCLGVIMLRKESENNINDKN
jgi:Domain of unknown function (DUF4386)